MDEVGDGSDRNPNRRQTNDREHMLALHSQISTLQRSVQDVKASLEQNQVSLVCAIVNAMSIPGASRSTLPIAPVFKTYQCLCNPISLVVWIADE